MRAFWWAVSLALLAVIWAFGSSASPLGLSPRHPFDWLGHLLEYLALGYALGRASGRRGLALGLAAWVGAADEVHQAFVAGREAGIQNWLWALAGAWLGSRVAVRRVPEAPDRQPAAPGPAVPPTHSP